MKKIRIFLILLIILIKLSKPTCTGSDCECAFKGNNPTCTELTPNANYNCVAKTGDDTYACQETPKGTGNQCTGSQCECALKESNPTCTELTPNANYNCVARTDDGTYACQETPKEKVDNCVGSDCKCAFKGNNPTCTELTAQDNYICVAKTDDDTYACQETPKDTNEDEHTNNIDTPINQTTKINSDTTASDSEGVHMIKFSLIEFILLILF